MPLTVQVFPETRVYLRRRARGRGDGIGRSISTERLLTVGMRQRIHDDPTRTEQDHYKRAAEKRDRKDPANDRHSHSDTTGTRVAVGRGAGAGGTKPALWAAPGSGQPPAPGRRAAALARTRVRAAV